MSQRIFRYQDLEVLTGWDHPLQYYFLVIESQNPLPPEDSEEESLDPSDEYVFTNLSLPNPAMTIQQISDKLTALNITPPRSLFEDLHCDRLKQISDRYDYGTYPNFTIPPMKI
jgi:hypothetical protein